MIRTFKGSNGIIVTTLEDYILGRTNEHLSVRIDDLEEKIKNFNSGCAQSINLDQVIAYIDANIKDVKDFVGMTASAAVFVQWYCFLTCDILILCVR